MATEALIEKSESKFQNLSKALDDFFKRLWGKIPKTIQNLAKELLVEVEPGSLEFFEPYPITDEIGKYFEELIPEFTGLKYIHFFLNSRFVHFISGDIIRNFIDFTFKIWIHTASQEEFIEKLLKMLNSFRKQIFAKKIPYSIVIPLKHTLEIEPLATPKIISTENSENLDDPSLEISLKTLEEKIIISSDGFWECRGQNPGGPNNFVPVLLIGRSIINFIGDSEYNSDVFKRITPEITDQLWEKLRNVCISIYISKNLVFFGKPQYIFPWWISSNISACFDFPEPEWMILRHPDYPDNSVDLNLINAINKGLLPDIDRQQVQFRELSEQTKQARKINPYRDPGIFISSGTPPMLLYFHNPIRDFDIIFEYYKLLTNAQSTFALASYNFVLTRLLLLGQREQISDTILDTCSILESLFLEGGEEITFKLSFRVGVFLAKNIGDIKTQIDFFKKLYGLRSSIVHGGNDWRNKCDKFEKKVFAGKKKGEFYKADIELMRLLFMIITDIFAKIISLNQNPPFSKYISNNDVLIDIIRNKNS